MMFYRSQTGLLSSHSHQLQHDLQCLADSSSQDQAFDDYLPSKYFNSPYRSLCSTSIVITSAEHSISDFSYPSDNTSSSSVLEKRKNAAKLPPLVKSAERDKSDWKNNLHPHLTPVALKMHLESVSRAQKQRKVSELARRKAQVNNNNQFQGLKQIDTVIKSVIKVQPQSEQAPKKDSRMLTTASQKEEELQSAPVGILLKDNKTSPSKSVRFAPSVRNICREDKATPLQRPRIMETNLRSLEPDPVDQLPAVVERYMLRSVPILPMIGDNDKLSSGANVIYVQNKKGFRSPRRKLDSKLTQDDDTIARTSQYAPGQNDRYKPGAVSGPLGYSHSLRSEPNGNVVERWQNAKSKAVQSKQKKLKSFADVVEAVQHRMSRDRRMAETSSHLMNFNSTS